MAHPDQHLVGLLNHPAARDGLQRRNQSDAAVLRGTRGGICVGVSFEFFLCDGVGLGGREFRVVVIILIRAAVIEAHLSLPRAIVQGRHALGNAGGSVVVESGGGSRESKIR